MASPVMIAKNQTASAIPLPRLGLTVPASPAVTTLTSYAAFYEISAETALHGPVTSGAIILNNGSVDLSPSEGIDYLNGPRMGTAQVSVFTAQAQTTDATVTELRTGSADHRMILQPNTTWVFSLWVAARQLAGNAGTVGDSAGWKAEGVIKRNAANTTALIAAVTAAKIAGDSATTDWAVSVTADNTNESLLIRVTGQENKAIRWEAGIVATKTGPWV